MSVREKDLIGYCGLDCEECFSYKMTLSEAAKNLKRELRAAKLRDSWKEIPFLGEYEPFKKTLDGLAMLRCPRGCRGGGGNPWCKIRKCAQKNSFWTCGECHLLENCPKLALITEGYKGKNLKILRDLAKDE